MRNIVFVLFAMGCAGSGLAPQLERERSHEAAGSEYRTDVGDLLLEAGEIWRAQVNVPAGSTFLQADMEGSFASARLSLVKDGEVACTSESTGAWDCTVDFPEAGLWTVEVEADEVLSANIGWSLGGVPEFDSFTILNEAISSSTCRTVGIPDSLGTLEARVAGSNQTSVSASTAGLSCDDVAENGASCRLTLPPAGAVEVCGAPTGDGMLSATWHPATPIVDTYLPSGGSIPFIVEDGAQTLVVRGNGPLRVLNGQFELCAGETECRIQTPVAGNWTAVFDGEEVWARVATVQGDDAIEACEVDAFEPNDTASDAAGFLYEADDLWVGQADSSDYFSLYVYDNETVTIDALFAHDAGDIDIRLENEDGGFLTNSLSTTDNEQVVWTNHTGAATHIILRSYLFGDEAACNVYDLRASYELTEAFLCNTPDATNVDPSTAATLPHEVTLNGTVTTEESEDWYTTWVPAGHELLVDVRFVDAAGDIDAAIEDEAGLALDFGTSTSDDERLGWANATDEDMNVRIRVHLFGSAEGVCNNYEVTATTSTL